MLFRSGLDGFEVCRILRREMTAPILMLTAKTGEIDKVVGLELGADDYVVKPYNLRELIARARALIRRAYGELAEGSPGEKIVFGEVEIDLEGLRVTRAGQPVYLTPTEFRLLRYLASRSDRPATREALIEAVWGYDSAIGSDRMVGLNARESARSSPPPSGQRRFQNQSPERRPSTALRRRRSR